MPLTLLDTDILSAVMRRHPVALARARAYLTVHPLLTFSIITQYEILRGLNAKSSATQQAAFGQFCRSNHILPLAENVVLRAAEIYADLHRRGQLIGDADILIAATAQVGGYAVATNNERHFARIPGLVIENWLTP